MLLTGVSKLSKVSLFSGLNNLRDITLSPAYSPVCGFTEAGLVGVLAAELEGLDRELFGAGASVFGVGRSLQRARASECGR